MEDDEFLDLVNDADVVIGKELRSVVKEQRFTNYRVVNVFIVNSSGAFWIPRRTKDKKQFPLALDFSVGGHVESGETYEETLRRECREELNIDTESQDVRLLGNLTPQKDGVAAFMNVYEIKLDEVPRYNPADFIEYFWLTRDALLARISSGDYAKDDLPKVIKIFYTER